MDNIYFFNFDKIAYIKGGKPEGCILCKIRERDPDIPNLTAYEDEHFLVSLNLYPYNPGHLIIFPALHLEDIREYTREQENRLTGLTKYFLTILDATHGPTAYNVGYNMGLVAGASINHLHMHIIPRYPREIGLADLIAGKRVLIEDPRETLISIKKEMDQRPFSTSMT